MRRPWTTAPNALTIPNAPATRPAAANEPADSRASSTIASPYMPIGSEPSAERKTGARTPGSRSSAP